MPTTTETRRDVLEALLDLVATAGSDAERAAIRTYWIGRYEAAEPTVEAAALELLDAARWALPRPGRAERRSIHDRIHTYLEARA